jgi:hypothetical protein
MGGRQRHPLYLEKQKVTIENNNINKKFFSFLYLSFFFLSLSKKCIIKKSIKKICNWQILTKSKICEEFASK